MKKGFAVSWLAASFFVLTSTVGCPKEKPKETPKETLRAKFESEVPDGVHISEKAYVELFKELEGISPNLRREALAENLRLPTDRLYGKERGKAFEGLFVVSPDKRQELLARELSPIFNKINRDAWEELAMVAPGKRAEALTRSCVVGGKPLVDPAISKYVEFNYLLVAMAMAYEARKGGFENEDLHGLAMAVMLDPEWYFLYPPVPGNDEEGAGPFESLQPLSVTLTPTVIRLGAREVADVVCRIDGEDCTGNDLAKLEECARESDSSICSKASLSVPPEFKENQDPNNLVISPLQEQLRARGKGKLEALDMLGRVFKGRITLFIHPAVTFQVLVETIYSVGMVSFPGHGSIRDFQLRTHPQALETTNRQRRTILPVHPKPGDRAKPAPTVLVSYDRLILKIPQGRSSRAESVDVVFKKKEQPVCGWGQTRNEYDYAGLYAKLVELREDADLSFGDRIHLGAKSGIPWHVLSRVFDTVSQRREKDSYANVCELLSAPLRTETGRDTEGNLAEVPMDLFPYVILVVVD